MSAKEGRFQELDPAEAVRRLEQDPESLMFPLASFCLQFGLSEIEFRTEAISGRLEVCGVQSPNGFTDCAVSAGALARWLANPNTPQKHRDYFDHIDRVKRNRLS